ncbi:putative voltage-dependent channel domain superfamily [Plasmopara halstedii]
MEKRKIERPKIGESTSAARNIVSNAESTGSTRHSNNNRSKSSVKLKQQRVKTQHHSNSENRDDSKQLEDDKDENKSIGVRLQTFIETTEAQVIMILLIAFDICGTAIKIHLHDRQQLAAAWHQLDHKDTTAYPSAEVIASLIERIIIRLIESFTGFTLFLFLIELGIALVTFRLQFFSRAGYVLDLAIVGTSLVIEMYAQTKVVRLFGVLRFWRVLRLIRQFVDQERAAHDITRQLLEQKELKLLHVEMQRDAARESLKREYESRKGLDNLVCSYKDEIVTLKEALEIAAQAVAEASIYKSDSAGYEYNKEAIYHNNDGAEVSPEQWNESDIYNQEVLSTEMQQVDGNDYQRHYETAALISPETLTETQAEETDIEFQDTVEE